MALTLLAGPANSGKVARLLECYSESLDGDPFLIVPNRSDVERVERELLRGGRALIGGSIGTFDDLFREVGGESSRRRRPILTDAQRRLVVRDLVRRAQLNGLTASARFPGFGEALLTTIVELESGLVEPDDVGGRPGSLYAAYRRELDRLEVTDPELERGAAAERVQRELTAWGSRPIFAYGFEDLTGAQWGLLEGLAARTAVTVSLPYEPSRAAFASLQRTAGDLADLAGTAIEERQPAYAQIAPPALAHLERSLFSPTLEPPPPVDGAIRFLEGAGPRGVLELVGEEILRLLRSGVAADEIVVVCPSLERFRAPLDTAFGTLGIPFGLDGRAPLARTSLGFALVSLLRFAWLGGDRRQLYAFLRSPYSGLSRAHVDYLEGRLRGRSISSAERTEEETLSLRGRAVPALEELRAAPTPVGGTRELVRFMLQAAHGLESPPVGERARLDLRAYEAVRQLLQELDEWQARAGAIDQEDVVSALERVSVRLPGGSEPGRVAVVDLLRARTRRVEIAFVLGLEEGSLPRRARPSPFLDDEARSELESRVKRARLPLPDALARDRYLFYTACTRPSRRLYLVREAATDDGSRREASPFWHEVRLCLDGADAERWTRRRALSSLTWPLETAPTERERLRSVSELASRDIPAATAIAQANGWERRLDRALGAFDRPTRLTHPAILEDLRRRTTFGVTELESFATCSSLWLVDRLLDPKTIDPEVDARLRGQVAHQTLYRFFSGLPKRLGSERVEPGSLVEALAFLRECLDDALTSQVRLELSELDQLELAQGLWRDLERFVRAESESELPLVPRRFEVLFGSDRAAPELQRGLDLGGVALSGKIDRIDLDPFSARGIIQDYKSGTTAHSATRMEAELKLQIPLYMLVLRDLIGVEPLGGLYRALGGEQHARGLLRETAKDDGVPGFVATDYLDDEAFWGQVERAKDHARGFVGRIRSGDVRHDPLNGFPCPSWCDRFPICRVRRA